MSFRQTPTQHNSGAHDPDAHRNGRTNKARVARIPHVLLEWLNEKEFSYVSLFRIKYQYNSDKSYIRNKFDEYQSANNEQ